MVEHWGYQIFLEEQSLCLARLEVLGVEHGDEPSGYLAMYFSNLTSFEQSRVDVIRL